MTHSKADRKGKSSNLKLSSTKAEFFEDANLGAKHYNRVKFMEQVRRIRGDANQDHRVKMSKTDDELLNSLPYI
jgi:RAB protein geranylgeranyltransferase component A